MSPYQNQSDNDYPRRIRILENEMAAANVRWNVCEGRHKAIDDKLAHMEATVDKIERQVSRWTGGLAILIPVLSFAGTLLAAWVASHF